MANQVSSDARVTVQVSVTFTVTEEEARALDALAGYYQAAIDAFYKGCGKSYVQPYEAGLRSFLKTIGSVVSPALNEADRLRAELREADRVRADLLRAKPGGKRART